MPTLVPTTRRAWVVAWAVLCAAGLAVTLGLNASSGPEPRPEKPVSARCAKLIAGIERQLAKNDRDGKKDGVVAFSRVRSVGEDDCREALRDHFDGDR